MNYYSIECFFLFFFLVLSLLAFLCRPKIYSIAFDTTNHELKSSSGKSDSREATKIDDKTVASTTSSNITAAFDKKKKSQQQQEQQQQQQLTNEENFYGRQNAYAQQQSRTRRNRVPFFYIFSPSLVKSSSTTRSSIDDVQPPFLNLVKAVEEYRSNADKVVATMVNNADIAKKSELSIFEYYYYEEQTKNNDSQKGGSRNNASWERTQGHSNDDVKLKDDPFMRNIHVLSLKLEEKARRTAELLEKNYFLLKELIQPFDVVYGLPYSCCSDHDHRRYSNNNDSIEDIKTDNYGGKATKNEKDLLSSSSSYDSALQILTHIVRDWSPLGQRIRESLFDWVIDTLLYYKSKIGDKPILVPGAGLGRLAFEINRVGFHVEANEISIVMAAAAYRFLNDEHEGEEEKEGLADQDVLFLEGEIYPFVDDFTINEVNSEDRFQSVMFHGSKKSTLYSSRRMSSDIHDSSASTAATKDEQRRSPFGKQGDEEVRKEKVDSYATKNQRDDLSFSYTIGDFIQLYSTLDRGGQYGAIVTCFFIDTATNIYEYILVMKNALKRDGHGTWINVGPLQWHGNSKLHVSGDELRLIIESMGFIIESWQIDEEAINYRHDDLNESPRYTKYEGYKPLRFVATMVSSSTSI